MAFQLAAPFVIHRKTKQNTQKVKVKSSASLGPILHTVGHHTYVNIHTHTRCDDVFARWMDLYCCANVPHTMCSAARTHEVIVCNLRLVRDAYDDESTTGLVTTASYNYCYDMVIS